MKMNWDAVGQTGRPDFKPVPPGQYYVVVEKVEEKEKTLAVRYEICDGEWEGRKIFDNVPTSPKAAWRIKKLASNCGIVLSGEMEFDPQSLIGKFLKVDTVQSGKYLNVSEYYRIEDRENKSEKKGDDIPF